MLVYISQPGNPPLITQRFKARIDIMANTETNMEVAESPVELKEHKFTFRKDKELGTKRAPVILQLPVPTVHGLREALRDPVKVKYIISLLENDVRSAAKSQIEDDAQPVSKQSELRSSELSLEYLANLPASTRGENISDEVKTAFVEYYTAIMPGLTKKSEEAVANAASLLRGGLRRVKNNKVALGILQDQLNKFIAALPEEQLEEIVDFVNMLSNRCENYLKADDVKPEDNL
jgi:hypothetical protein